MKSEVSQQVTTTVLQEAVSKAPYLGATVTIVGGYTLNEWLAIVGIFFTVLTFFLNWYMQSKRLELIRKEIERKVNVKTIKGQRDEES